MATLQEWQYQAIDPGTTQVMKGTMDAASEAAVTAKLRAQGLMPVQIEPLEKTGLQREITLPSLNRGVSAKTIAIFARQMAALINAGLPLMRTLAVLAEQTSDKRLRSVLTTVAVGVESGSSLSAALQRHPLIFPPLMVSIVRVGESGGFLGAALTSIAENYQKQAELHGRIRSATTYPAVVLVIALIGVLVMVTFIVPVFENMFSGLGGELPLPTQILVTVSHNMVWILPALIVVLAIAWIW